ncbi:MULTISPECIES: PaaX family transcriptional regulator C-terminal domain-containing protein [Thermomonosporaceae]|uniref:PaaX family transcriptional regulator C-terminal domain-containing protein n=1 Tax=Thermomonosporaceae TaxID=2012 RepID=UPI00255ABC76|nr:MULTISPECIES: PaaX family transcriptional regulator C-terminal domain-containing protein [Thermomonosporaceae]MDL4772313.1 PaaX family transcriptional regulator C-terminal domain-containing protein [Actinomadura xylanilytica]
MPEPAVQVPTRTLVEALIRIDHTVDTAELYAIAPLLGMTDQQVRLCVKRLVTEGRFTQEGRGRKAVLRATSITEQTLGPDIEFVAHAFQQDAGLAPWDGVWHLVAFAVPETARPARDALRAALTRLGGAPVQGGLYISPNAWEPHVEAQARHLGVLDHLTLLTTDSLRQGDERDPAALARALWPQDEIADRYQRLASVARPRLRRLHEGTELPSTQWLTIAIELAAEFTRAMEPDPLLPPQLLCQPWPGTQARELVAQCWSLLEEHAEVSEHFSLFQLYRDVTRPSVAGT